MRAAPLTTRRRVLQRRGIKNMSTTTQTEQAQSTAVEAAAAIKATAQAKQAKAASKEDADKAAAAALIEKVREAIASIESTIFASVAGPLALKQAAAEFGANCDRSGAPHLASWQVMGLIAAAVNPGLRLRQECADIARSQARKRLAVAITDDLKLRRAVDKNVKITGKGSAQDAGGTLAIKFGTPAKIESVF